MYVDIEKIFKILKINKNNMMTFEAKRTECKKNLKEAMSEMEMFVPCKIMQTRKANKGELEVQIVWALFEDDTASYSWESVKDLPDWFLKENEKDIYGK